MEIAKSGDVVVAATEQSVFGLSATSGKILWQAEVFQGRRIASHGEALILVHQNDDSFGAAGLDRKTGKALWSESISGANLVEFQVAGDLVHVIGSRAVEQDQDDGTTLFVPTKGEVRTVLVCRRRNPTPLYWQSFWELAYEETP
jgi:outer membrane protein assembly factor BamB